MWVLALNSNPRLRSQSARLPEVKLSFLQVYHARKANRTQSEYHEFEDARNKSAENRAEKHRVKCEKKRNDIKIYLRRLVERHVSEFSAQLPALRR